MTAEPNLRIATWNVDSIRARMDLVDRWIECHRPDVVCLQETKVSDRLFPRSRFERHDMAVISTDAGGYGGVAVASRLPLLDVVIGIPGAAPPLDEQRSISFTVPESAPGADGAEPGPGLRCHTLYAPNGRKVGTRHHDIKRYWFKLFTRWLELDGVADRPTMVLGDFNIAPTDADVWEPSRYRKRNLTSPPERALFNDLLDAGLVEVGRDHSEGGGFTWWNRRSDFFETDRGWRLDHVLADPSTAARIVDCRVDRSARSGSGTSDHAPILVRF